MSDSNWYSLVACITHSGGLRPSLCHVWYPAINQFRIPELSFFNLPNNSLSTCVIVDRQGTSNKRRQIPLSVPLTLGFELVARFSLNLGKNCLYSWCRNLAVTISSPVSDLIRLSASTLPASTSDAITNLAPSKAATSLVCSVVRCSKVSAGVTWEKSPNT